MVKLVRTTAGYRIYHGIKSVGKIIAEEIPRGLHIGYITINKTERSHGYATQALRTLIKKYARITTTTVAIGNAASRKLFTGAGFKEIKSGAQLKMVYIRP